MLELGDFPEHVDSFEAQIVSFYVNAEYPDQWLAFDDRFVEGLWIEGRGIRDVDVLVDIAEDAGLNGDEIRTVVSDEELRDRLREQFTDAQQEGVTGVPTFVYDGYGARGVVPPKRLERLVEES